MQSFFVKYIIVTHKFGGKIQLNVLINYYELKELICQDKYKKIQLKLAHENARTGRSENIANFV